MPDQKQQTELINDQEWLREIVEKLELPTGNGLAGHRLNPRADVLILFLLLRRMDCCLEPVKEKLLWEYEREKDRLSAPELEESLYNLAYRKTQLRFYNISRHDFASLKAEPRNIDATFRDYLQGYDKRTRKIIKLLKLEDIYVYLKETGKLHETIALFSEFDLSMGKYATGSFIRKFVEHVIVNYQISPEVKRTGHFTPRDVIDLMRLLLFEPDDERLWEEKRVSLYDHSCGVGGMLFKADSYIRETFGNTLNLELYGQEVNRQYCGIAKAELLLAEGKDPDKVEPGEALFEDAFPQNRFDYCMVDTTYRTEINGKTYAELKLREEAERTGRYFAGLPEVAAYNPTARLPRQVKEALSLQHIISKMNAGRFRVVALVTEATLLSFSPREDRPPYGRSTQKKSNILEINRASLYAVFQEIRKTLFGQDLVESIVSIPREAMYDRNKNPKDRGGLFLITLNNAKPEQLKNKVLLMRISGDAKSRYVKAVNQEESFKPAPGKTLEIDQDKIMHDYMNALTAPHEAQSSDEIRVLPTHKFTYYKIKIHNSKDAPQKTKTLTIPAEKFVKLKDMVERRHSKQAWYDLKETKVEYELDFDAFFANEEAQAARLAEQLSVKQSKKEALRKQINDLDREIAALQRQIDALS